MYSDVSAPIADVSFPPFAAVAAIERASIRATYADCPFPGFEPSRLGKFLVVWRILNAPFEGTSPAPKHGPQNAERTVTPEESSFVITPFSINAVNTG